MKIFLDNCTARLVRGSGVRCYYRVSSVPSKNPWATCFRRRDHHTICCAHVSFISYSHILQRLVVLCCHMNNRQHILPSIIAYFHLYRECSDSWYQIMQMRQRNAERNARCWFWGGALVRLVNSRELFMIYMVCNLGNVYLNSVIIQFDQKSCQ